MQVVLGNVWTLVASATEDEDRFLWDYLSYKDQRAMYSEQAQSGQWDGRVRMFDRRKRRFPTGLLPLLRKGAQRGGFVLDEDDLRPGRRDPLECAYTFLDRKREQPEMLDACLKETRGLVWCPTGGGKSRVIAALTADVPCSWVVVVPTLDLLHQVAGVITECTGERAGIMGDGKSDPQRVTVATFQTLARSLRAGPVRELLTGAGGVIVDEAHTLAADSPQRVLKSMPNAYWRFGFSGTPLGREDGKNVLVMGQLGGVIYKVKATALQERGVLSEAEIVFETCEQSVPGYAWDTVYKNGVVDSLKRNRLVVELVKKTPRPALVFVKAIEHGYALRNMLEREHLRVDYVWGNDDTSRRTSGIQRLRRGEMDVLVCSTIFDTGVDIPELRGIVNAAGGKSVIKALQRLGRGLRSSDGKQRLEMYDVFDCGHPWLISHSKARVKAYKTEGFNVRVEGTP